MSHCILILEPDQPHELHEILIPQAILILEFLNILRIFFILEPHRISIPDWILILRFHNAIMLSVLMDLHSTTSWHALSFFTDVMKITRWFLMWTLNEDFSFRRPSRALWRFKHREPDCSWLHVHVFKKKGNTHSMRSFKHFRGCFKNWMKTARRIFLGFFEILLSNFLKNSRIRRGCLEDCTNNEDILRFQFDDLSRNCRGFEDSTRI
jgi:hypothetical protein